MVGIVAHTAVPNLRTLNGSILRMNARMQVLQDLRQAQALTVVQGCRGIFKVINSGTGYTFGCDYLPYDVTSPPSHDALFFTRNFPNGFSIATSTNVIFSSRGNLVNEAGDIASATLSLTDSVYSGSPTVFGSGTIYGTGVFDFDVG